MPLHMQPVDVSTDLKNVKSVLIVSCPVCPPVSLAVQQDSPLVEFFKSGIKTGAFEAYVQEIRKPLGEGGVRTGVFTMYAPLPTMCLWTKGQRRRLLNRAKGYEAVLVLGCESARYTAAEALKETGCRVIQAMRTTGFTNANVKFHFPMTLTLEEKACVHESGEVEKVRL